MAYNSFAYLVVFLGAAFLCYTIAPMRMKHSVLLVFSYLFYFLNSRMLVLFQLFTTLTVYYAGIFMNRIDDGARLAKPTLPAEAKSGYRNVIKWQKRGVMLICVLLNVGILVFLKYYNFLSLSLDALMSALHLPTFFPQFDWLKLPAGISFYTLQASGYVIDVYRGKYRASERLGKVALFLVFFPQVVEGPIGRFDELGEQLYEGHPFDYKRDAFALQLILWGLFKKMVLADRANPFVDEVFGNYTAYSGAMTALGALVYTLQIYADFSGVIDIVTGSAELFGVRLAKNFDRPFFSHTVSEFWRRWHMTLGSWLRDYVFYPISLSRWSQKLGRRAREKLGEFLGGALTMSVALFAVWMTMGVWHGVGWKYTAYGLYYFLIVLAGTLLEPVNRFISAKTGLNRDSRGFKAWQILRTFLLVTVGMMLFRADTVGAFFHMFRSLFGGSQMDVLLDGRAFSHGMDQSDLLILALGAVLLLVVGLLQEKHPDLREALAEKPTAFRWTVYFALILALVIFGAYGGAYRAVDPIYGRF